MDPPCFRWICRFLDLSIRAAVSHLCASIALGHGHKRPATSEANTAAVARRSLIAAQDIPSGTVLTEELIAIKRPGTGLAPAMYPYLIGRTARTTIQADTLLTLEMLE